MEKVLFLAHTDEDGKLGKAALEALGAAKSLADSLPGSTLTAALFGAGADAAAGAIAACGAAQYLAVSGADFEQSRYSTDAAAAEALCRAAGATVIVTPATARMSRIASGLGHRLQGVTDTHITGLAAADGTVVATRWYYRQRIVGSIKRPARPWILTTDPGAFPTWSGAAGQAAVEKIDAAIGDAQRRTRVAGTQSPSTTQQTIRPEAKVLFVAGAGWTKKQKDGQQHPAEAANLILTFLDKTQSSLGGSKSVVDQKGEGQAVLDFMTHLNQVGQTGSTPRHPKGLATCCHGEEPHVVGWRFVNERRAVNMDPNCGWAQGKADVLYVADAFEVMEKVNKLLEG